MGDTEEGTEAMGDTEEGTGAMGDTEEGAGAEGEDTGDTTDSLQVFIILEIVRNSIL